MPLMFIGSGMFMMTHIVGGEAMMMEMTEYDKAQNVLHGVAGLLMIFSGIVRWRLDYDTRVLVLYCLLVNTFSGVWSASAPGVLYPLVDKRLDGNNIAFLTIIVSNVVFQFSLFCLPKLLACIRQGCCLLHAARLPGSLCYLAHPYSPELQVSFAPSSVILSTPDTHTTFPDAQGTHDAQGTTANTYSVNASRTVATTATAITNHALSLIHI